VLLAGAILAASAIVHQDTKAQAPDRPHATGEVIVKYRAGASPREIARARGRVSAIAASPLLRSAAARRDGEVELVRLPPGLSVGLALARLTADRAVDYAEPNWIYTHAITAPCSASCTTDPSFADQWALNNTGQTIGGASGGTADADVDAPEAWTQALGSAGVYVAVLDEGIDFAHPDLGAQPAGPIWTNPFDSPDGVDNDGNGFIDDVHGWDFAGNDNTVYDGSAADPYVDSHGTHVAGIIGAKVDNGVGVAGINWAVTIVPLKFLAPAGGTTANAVRALDYLVDLKTRHNLNIVAVNNSWGGGGYSQSLLDAIGRAATADILFVVAAGNGGGDGVGDDNDAFAQYPASYDTTAAAGFDSVVAVAATGRSDELAPWSNFGAKSVHIGAPGVAILSTYPQNAYAYSSGTSMAAPHVTGAAALISGAQGLTGAALLARLLGSVDSAASLQTRTATGGRLNLRAGVAPSAGIDEVVLYASGAAIAGSAWSVVADATAASGARLQNPDLGAAKVSTALAAPASYADLTFAADAGKPYRLWIRGKGDKDAWANDSVHVQFSDSVTAGGAAAWRIGTTDSSWVSIENCTSCGIAGWGWQDNGYGAGVLGPLIYFTRSGTHILRFQAREDGIGIDQIVLSAVKYADTAPGALKNDTTILPATTAGTTAPPSAAVDEVVLYPGNAPTIVGRWAAVADLTAAGGVRMQNAEIALAKIITASATPADYFEMTFRADAGKPYRLWIRGKATSDSYANDSVHVQFGDSVDATGTAVFGIGTTSSTIMNLEDCSGCGVSGWGWQDNGYGAGVLGPVVYFQTTGVHTIRIQTREDGLGIDQIVLSAVKYISTSPGALKKDSVILGK
jgi:subtilisin family serine protease